MDSLSWYKNDNPLIMKAHEYSYENITELDLNMFPIVDDFEIFIRDCGNDLGLHLDYHSRSLNSIITTFPWWDNVDRDLIKMNLQDIPVVKIDKPYDDCEQSGQILIWEDGDFVYIMEGEDPCCLEYPVWFRVKKNRNLD